MRDASGDLGLSTDHDLDTNTRMSEHCDQRIDAESVNLPSNEITHPRLSHAEEIGCLGLRKSARLDHFAESDHQVGPHLEVLGLLA